MTIHLAQAVVIIVLGRESANPGAERNAAQKNGDVTQTISLEIQARYLAARVLENRISRGSD